MNSPSANGQKESKWGYAFAGVIALGAAAVVQFVFGDLDPEMRENLPGIFAVPYAIGGKLGLTVPLAVVGLCLILRDLMVHGGGNRQTATAPRASKRVARKDEEELETGEPIIEGADGAPIPGAPKIPATRGRFESTRGNSVTGGPTDGQIVLASAKYLNTKAGKPDFRKGKTVLGQSSD